MNRVDAEQPSQAAKLSVGSWVIAPGIQAAVPRGLVTLRRWSQRFGWLYAVLWDEGPDAGQREIGRRRNMGDDGQRIKWLEKQLQRVQQAP